MIDRAQMQVASYISNPLKNTRTHPSAEPPKSPDLPTPPPKALDLRRIEGEGLDLHRHRPEFISPLIWLRGPLARVS